MYDSVMANEPYWWVVIISYSFYSSYPYSNKFWAELSYIECFLACYYMILSLSVPEGRNRVNRRKISKCGRIAWEGKMVKSGEVKKYRQNCSHSRALGTSALASSLKQSNPKSNRPVPRGGRGQSQSRSLKAQKWRTQNTAHSIYLKLNANWPVFRALHKLSLRQAWIEYPKCRG